MKKIKLDIDKAKKLYKSGFTCEQVAKEMNVCKRTIIRRFQEIEYKTREPSLKHGLLKKNLSGKQRAKNKRMLYPEKIRARELLNYHLKIGNIIKPNDCGNCRIKTSRLQGHHKDYNKPLEIEWLCIKCHNKIHRDPHS